jgi:predicted SAM-dependent methyltransferase
MFRGEINPSYMWRHVKSTHNCTLQYVCRVKNRQYFPPTFLTVLSGSRTMSGMLASTMRENKFRMRLEYLERERRKRERNEKGSSQLI